MIGFEFSCPNTGGRIEHGIEDAECNQAGAKRVRFTAFHVRCPHCGEHHEIEIDDDTLNAAA